MIKLVDLLNEGVFDKGILKVFLAGGPGSGKTWQQKVCLVYQRKLICHILD